MFVVEGAVTVVFGVICFFFMPDTPATARFLSAEEKEWALRRMRLDAHGSTQVDVDEEKFDWYWVKMALKAPQTYFNGFIWFFLLVSATFPSHPLKLTAKRSPSTASLSSSPVSCKAWATTLLPRSSSPFPPT